MPLPARTLRVAASEAGMKLLRFLGRRLEPGCPASRLHKWIRTGQVRVNGGRAHFGRSLAVDDLVRLPPFASIRPLAPPGAEPVGNRAGNRAPEPFLGPGLSLAFAHRDFLVLNKAGGLACQPGTGQEDSVAERLCRAFAGAAYIPAPAHRLDRRTSGLLLAALTHAAQQRLHRLFRTGRIRKEYLAWVLGAWPHTCLCLLRDRLRQITDASGKERMAALPGGSLETFPFPGPCPSLPFADPCPSLASVPFPPRAAYPSAEKRQDPRPATCALVPVWSPAREELPFLPPAPAGGRTKERATLLLIRPFTGRRHQIRVQLASRGFPLIGDRRYGGPPFSALLLHAYALSLPPEFPAIPEFPPALTHPESPAPSGSPAPLAFPPALAHPAGTEALPPPESPASPQSLPLQESPAPPPPAEKGGRGESPLCQREFIAPVPWPAPFAPDPARLAKARALLAKADAFFFPARDWED